MDVTQLLPYVAAAAAHPLGKYLVRQGAQFVRARQAGITTVELKRAETEAAVRLKQAEGDDKLVAFLMSSLDEVKEDVRVLTAHVKTLEQEHSDMRVENAQLKLQLADEKEYAANLLEDNKRLGIENERLQSQIQTLTNTIAEKYRTAGA